MERAMGSEVRRAYCGASHIISSVGVGVESTYSSIEGYVNNITNFSDATPLCLIDRGGLELDGLEGHPFVEQLAILSLRSVISRSGIDLSSCRTLVILSTTKGDVESLNENFDGAYLWSTANSLSNYFGCATTPLIYSNACVSGVGAVVIAARKIESGEYDNIVVVGVDVVSEFAVCGFNSFKSVSPSVCRPYDASRDGLTLGEACGVLLVTSQRELSESKIIISGGAISDDANHISGPSRTGDGLYFAMRNAMHQAQVSASDLGFVNAHGTATPYNDEMESKALALAGLCGVPCNSLKPYLGHTLGASGVVEIILSHEQMLRGVVFGVKGYEQCGVPYPLNVEALHRERSAEHCLKTASGFGGTNAAVVLSRESACRMARSNRREVAVAELAHVELKSEQGVDFDSYIRSEYKLLGVPNMKFFKMDNLSKLAYVTSSKLMQGVNLEDIPTDRRAVVIATRSSSLDTDLRHQAMVDEHLPEGASPAIFVYTLANVMAAEVAIRNKFQGELSIFVEEHKSLEFVESYARDLVADDRCDVVLFGWCDLLGEEYNAEFKLIKGL